MRPIVAAAALLAGGFVVSSCFTSVAFSVSLLLFPKEKFPGKINRNLPFCLSKLGTTQAARAS